MNYSENPFYREEGDRMNKRKQYLIDKKFQLKYTFTIIGISFIVIALIIAMIAFNAAFNNIRLNRNNNELNTIIENQSNVLTIQDNIVQALLTYSQSVTDRTQRKAVNDVYTSHANNMQTIQRNIVTIRGIVDNNKATIRYNNTLLIIISVVVVFQGLLLFYLLIRKTNKLSGPMYVMSGYMKMIINGTIPAHVRDIRKDDELHDFYELFMAMIESLKEMETKDKKSE